MNIKKRLIAMKKRRDPEANCMCDTEIEEKFLKGFSKKASPLLTDNVSDADGSEHQKRSQQILEDSYRKEDNLGLSKRQIKDKKAVDEDGGVSSSQARSGERG